MAESDGKPASSPISTEEADRLSEKFKPSWETEPEPPTVPRVEPPVRIEPTISVEPPVKIEPTINVEPPVKIEPTVSAEPAVKIEPTIDVGAPKPHLGKQTLLGVAVPLPAAPPEAATRANAPDDLDWELPTNPAPSPIQEAPPIEPPPKSSPSGMGEKYVPKETGAPPIVLTDEVKQAEEHARAQLAAEHRARSAPTLLKLKAIDVQPKVASSDDDADFAPPRKSLGVWIGLGVGVCAAIIGVMALVRGGNSSAPEPPPEPVKAASPEPEAPPPLTATAAPPLPVERPDTPVVAPVDTPPEPEAKPVVAPAPKPAAPPKPVRPAATAPRQQPVAAAPKPASPKPTQAPPKPTAPAAKPAPPKPAAGGIVRDAPF
jgi:hypothetical protein